MQPENDKEKRIEELKYIRYELRKLRAYVSKDSKFFGIRNKREKIALLNIAESTVDKMIGAIKLDNLPRYYALEEEYRTLTESEFDAIFTDPNDGCILVKKWFLRLASASIGINFVIITIVLLNLTLAYLIK